MRKACYTRRKRRARPCNCVCEGAFLWHGDRFCIVHSRMAHFTLCRFCGFVTTVSDDLVGLGSSRWVCDFAPVTSDISCACASTSISGARVARGKGHGIQATHILFVVSSEHIDDTITECECCVVQSWESIPLPPSRIWNCEQIGYNLLRGENYFKEMMPFMCPSLQHHHFS